MEAGYERELEVEVVVVVVVEDTTSKEQMRTNSNWTEERKIILAKETLSSKLLHGTLKSQDKQSLRSVCGVCTLM